MAAALARDGYTGPEGVFEGKFGLLKTFCRDAEPARLTRELGSTWHVMKNKIKRYACHSTAQVPVTLALELKAKHSVSGEDVVRITIAGNEKTVNYHGITEPKDLTMAQYSVPFCVALALYLDPTDPRVFSEQSLNDPRIRALCRSAQVAPLKAGSHPSQARVTLQLKNGKEISAEGHDFKGTPTMPLTRGELLEKFLKLTAHRDRAKTGRLFAHLADAEKVADFSTLDFAL
jgi:2-methylcitrate dehydratase PrpD